MAIKDKRSLIDENSKLGIKRQCELINLNRAAYYYEPVPISANKLALLNCIDEIYTMHPYYGTRRMSKELEDYGYHVGRDEIRSCYAILGLEAIYPKPNLSKNNAEHKVYPYLLRGVLIQNVNHVWSADITYVRLKHGFAYLIAIIDWFSRFILSWRLSNSLHHDFCVEALDEALSKYQKPMIFNTDQGTQFTSNDWINRLLAESVRISMDGRGRALDNVFIERFWRSYKQEKVYISDLQNMKDAKLATNEYIQFYNTKRKHQSLDYKVPLEIYYAN